MEFKRERAHDVWQEMIPLMEKHWEEIAHYKDIPLNPDYETYLKMEDANILRVFTARDDDGVLIGYAVFFLKHNLHYKDSYQALQDIIYVDPERRGIGARLILWSEKQLKADGVQVVCQHIKASTPHTVELFERLGYEKIDIILGKRLDGG